MEDKYHEEDEVGLETLNVVGSATNFNKWMFDVIKPYCKGSILEIGSGIGNISEHLLQVGEEVTLSDLRIGYTNYLEEKFADDDTLREVLVMDVTDLTDEFIDTHRYDTIVMLNVLEHIEDDRLALTNCYRLLKPGGKLVLLVPAYQYLYCNFDKELGHFRRYETNSAKVLISEVGYKIFDIFHFNFLGIAGWFLTGKVLKRDLIPEGQMSLYNFITPAIRFLDKLLFRKVGLSLVVIAEKE